LLKQELYRELNLQIRALCEGEPNLIANLANISALIYERLEDTNWAGFYLMSDNLQGSAQELVLGPFQGKAACVRIPVGRGVCGTAVADKQSQLIEDVHAFAGHIACDAASNSEVVVPIIVNDVVVAVLDIDSPSLARFDQDDLVGLEQVGQFVESIWS
jgi:GAF domain-containing protein